MRATLEWRKPSHASMHVRSSHSPHRHHPARPGDPSLSISGGMDCPDKPGNDAVAGTDTKNTPGVPSEGANSHSSAKTYPLAATIAASFAGTAIYRRISSTRSAV
ncbi:hypothetical protein FF80_02421 [Devosia sp. LC5]|nr:hypothetical protein FF80_02421 [Devosia sp. LC5]